MARIIYINNRSNVYAISNKYYQRTESRKQNAELNQMNGVRRMNEMNVRMNTAFNQINMWPKLSVLIGFSVWKFNGIHRDNKNHTIFRLMNVKLNFRLTPTTIENENNLQIDVKTDEQWFNEHQCISPNINQTKQTLHQFILLQHRIWILWRKSTQISVFLDRKSILIPTNMPTYRDPIITFWTESAHTLTHISTTKTSCWWSFLFSLMRRIRFGCELLWQFKVLLVCLMPLKSNMLWYLRIECC